MLIVVNSILQPHAIALLRFLRFISGPAAVRGEPQDG
jgi:hypothetical protein